MKMCQQFLMLQRLIFWFCYNNFVINNILKNIGNVDNVSWGPSDDGSKYIFEIKDVNTWEKDKVVEESA